MARAPKTAAFTRFVPWLAGALPLAYYVASASAHGGFFEEGSFVASARELSVAHAPGAPIESLLAAGFSLLPIGPLPFRVAIASALCAALTLALFARALMSTLRHVTAVDQRLAALLALAASLWLAGTPLFFQQAVRPQIFASQFALSMLIIYTLLRFEEEEPHGSTRVLYFGAFVQGLCFANHHVYGLLMLPVAAPTLGRVFARRGFIGLMGYMAAPLVGFSVYLYVPLRLAHMPENGLSELSGFARMLSMLSRDPYVGPDWALPVSTLSLLRCGLALSLTGLVLTLCALALGLWLSLRSSYRRRFGTLWFVALVVPLASAEWVVCPRVTEDAWGALLPSACALTAIASCGIARVAAWIGRFSVRARDGSALVLAGLSLLGLLLRDGREARALMLLSDETDELGRRHLAPSAVLFSSDESHAFWYRGREAEEGLRADVTLVPLAERTEPRALEAWAARDPELGDSLRALVLAGALEPGPLQSLSALRPVYLAPSQTLSPAVRATTLPEGLVLRVRSEGVTLRNLSDAQAQQAQRVAYLARLSEALPARSYARQKTLHALSGMEPEP